MESIQSTSNLINPLSAAKQKDMDLFDAWKGHLKADVVLKKDPHFFFCKKIDDIEFEMVGSEVIEA